VNGVALTLVKLLGWSISISTMAEASKRDHQRAQGDAFGDRALE
jgi:hypothetical protein